MFLNQFFFSGSQSFGCNKYFINQKAVFKINQHIDYTNRTPERIEFQAFRRPTKILTKVPVFLSQHSFWNLNDPKHIELMSFTWLVSLCEMCSEFFHVHIFLHLEWIQRCTHRANMSKFVLWHIYFCVQSING